MAEIPVVELQTIIIVVAIIAGAIRGVIGYFLTAPADEKLSLKKLGKTIVRYGVQNLVSINLMAAIGGITWTVNAIAVYTAVQIAIELGFDLKKT